MERVEIGFQVRPRIGATLVSLVINDDEILTEPVDFNDGELVVDLSRRVGNSFTFSWAVLFSADAKVASAVLFVDGKPIEVDKKLDPAGGSTWESDPFAFP